jgi:hypothetical protein
LREHLVPRVEKLLSCRGIIKNSYGDAGTPGKGSEADMAAGFIGTVMSCLLILLAAAVALAVCVQIVKRRAVAAVEDMMGVEGSGCVPKLEQIRVLKEAGISITPTEMEQEFILGLTPSENEYLASHPYYGFCILAGSRKALNCVYSTGDRECIYQWDSYGKILNGLKAISGLPFEEISGVERYAVTFRFHDRAYQWKARKNRDWMDTGMAGFLNRILDRQGGGEQRFYLDNSHEAPLYLYASAAMADRVNRETGLKFQMAKAAHSR